jgi:hypothetical protein
MVNVNTLVPSGHPPIPGGVRGEKPAIFIRSTTKLSYWYRQRAPAKADLLLKQ